MMRASILFFSLFLLLSPFLRAGDPLDQARAYAIAGDYEEALKIFQEQLVEQPRDPLLNYYVGVCYFFSKRLDRARFFLEESVKHKAGFPEAFYWLAHTHLALDDLEGAVHQVKAGLNHFPYHKKLIKLARTLGLTWDMPEASEPGASIAPLLDEGSGG